MLICEGVWSICVVAVEPCYNDVGYVVDATVDRWCGGGCGVVRTVAESSHSTDGDCVFSDEPVESVECEGPSTADEVYVMGARGFEGCGSGYVSEGWERATISYMSGKVSGGLGVSSRSLCASCVPSANCVWFPTPVIVFLFSTVVVGVEVSDTSWDELDWW